MLFLTFNMIHAQSSVDRLVTHLDSVTAFSVSPWKYSTDFEAGPAFIAAASAPDFDDAQWKILNFREYLYVDSCWLRSKIRLPERFLGQPVAGGVKLHLAVDDFGYLWVNGQEKGYFPWVGQFTLSENAKPDMEFILLIKAVNTGGPLRLLRAEIEFDERVSLVKQARNLSMSLKVGQKLLSFDTYQTNARVKFDPGVDKSRIKPEEKKKLNRLLQDAAGRIKVGELSAGRPDLFVRSVEEIRPALAQIDKFARRFTLYFSANAHIDAAWLWRKAETQEVCKNTFSSVIRMMEHNPDFTYTQSSAVFHKWMEELYPDLFQAIKNAEKQGRWELVGGSWIEPDCNLIGGESWWRQLLYGQKYFKNKFGKRIRIGWNPDSFGYNWNMPQFCQNAAIDAFITQKIGWNDTSVFPHRLFWWESPDGSRILSYFPFDYVNQVDDPFRLVDWLRQYEANTGLTKMMVLFGVGDHGGGPTPEMLQRIEDLKQLYIYPTVAYGISGEYLNWIRTQNLKNLPVWRDELYLEYHRGTYTTQAEMKRNNREMEQRLITLEKFACLAALYGHPYPLTDISDAWEKVLFNQFHDILPGSSIREVYVDAQEEYQEAREIADFHLEQVLLNLAGQINTSHLKEGRPVSVFNPLSWERSEIVSLELPDGDTQPYVIYDSHGQEIPTQRVRKNRFRDQLLFRADRVPALGYRVFELRAVAPSASVTDVSAHDDILENRFFRVTVDEKTGWVNSIWDKIHQREVLTGAGNELQVFRDVPKAWDAWNIGLGERFQTQFRRIELLENGPVRAILRVTHDFLHPATIKSYPTQDFPTTFFIQDVILYQETPRIDFCTRVDWWENHTMVKVAFPVSVEAAQATYEIPYATVTRPTRLMTIEEKGKWEVPALRWADLSQPDYGVSLLNKTKHGYDIKENVIRLSLLRSPRWPDPTADRGKHTIEYALYPHPAGWQQAGVSRQGYAFNTPMLAVVSEINTGKLPPEHGFIHLQPNNVVITGIKQAEEVDRVWIVQFCEMGGKKCEVMLQLPFKPSRMFRSNFLEDDLEPIRCDGNVIRLKTEANKIETLKIYL